MESNIIPVKVTSSIGTIEDNLDAVEAFIEEKCAEYESMVFAEGDMKDCKKFLADIRKEKRSIDEERRSIKKAWMEPYNLFEKRVKGIMALYDRPEGLINGQIEEYEKRRRESKRCDIQTEYDKAVSALAMPELADWLPLDRIYDRRWENATYSMKKIREDMQGAFRQMEMSVETIRSMKSEWEADALEVLRGTGNLQDAIGKIASLNEQKERIEEMRRREEEKKKQEEERIRQEEEMMRQEEEGHEQKEADADARMAGGSTQEARDESADLAEERDIPFAMERMVTLRVNVGENSLGILTDFLAKNNMEYEVI